MNAEKIKINSICLASLLLPILLKSILTINRIITKPITIVLINALPSFFIIFEVYKYCHNLKPFSELF